ncbi:hypothetical protein TWF594_010362 [Orbilia oligospora]|nr:hypothetical protein TWF103_002153 [Orbilia oligospora]KAF3130488.1 hypothetical protein TWF594_010362 [Orbilia oligospora]
MLEFCRFDNNQANSARYGRVTGTPGATDDRVLSPVMSRKLTPVRPVVEEKCYVLPKNLVCVLAKSRLPDLGSSAKQQL